MEASFIGNCMVEFNDFIEEYESGSKKERIINNLLVRIPESMQIDFNDVERLVTKEESIFD